MPRGLEKFVLTAHVAASVGWLGGVVAFLALAVAGLTSDDAQTVQAAYLMMELIGWYALVPLALASLLTGLVQSLGSKWGLFRHYWVLFKLLINVFATIVLLLYTQTLEHFARVAAQTTLASDDLSRLRTSSPLLHAGFALLLLLVATTLAIYKPQGLTPYGQRKQRKRSATITTRAGRGSIVRR
jgi:uncharacterized membrane protein